jgi:DNA-directed RNA polymerase subunit L
MQAKENPEQIRIRKERDFKPHHFLIYAARVGLEHAEEVTKEEKGISVWTPHELTAITFSAFALEAIGNSFGEKLVKRWKDFEYSSPIAKLRIVCAQLNIEPDFGGEPWATALWLVAFRNSIAHAKPRFIKTDEVVPASEYNFWHLHSDPQSEIEKQITLENARRAVKAISEILDQFYLKIKKEDRGSLFFENSSGMASSC